MCKTIDIGACTKHVPFVTQFVLEGPNYTTAAFKVHVRHLPGDSGSPLISLANAAPGAQGVSANYDAAYVHPITARVFPATILTVTVAKSTMKALALNSPTNGAVVAHYDMVITPSGGSDFMPFRGKFTYDPGVTV